MLYSLNRIFKSKNKFISDDYIKRLRSLVIGEGMLLDGNIELLDLAIKNIPQEGSVVEIGSYGGLSSNLIIYLMKKYNKDNNFFTCDAWVYEGYKDYLGSISKHIDGRDDISRADYSIYLKNAFINTIKFLNPTRLPYSFHLTSNLFFEKWMNGETETTVFDSTVKLGGKISFAYIDGDHSLEGALNDFQNVVNHLVKGGYILLDDSADHLNFGSAKMMSDIKNDKRFKVVAKNPNYLIQKIVE